MNIEQWIKANFDGRGVAVREPDENPIPGEPFMSMAVAKDLVRRFARCQKAGLIDEA